MTTPDTMPTQEQDITRLCRTCYQPFNIRVDEQRFLQDLQSQRGWKRDCLPWHCSSCRRERKAARDQE